MVGTDPRRRDPGRVGCHQTRKSQIHGVKAKDAAAAINAYPVSLSPDRSQNTFIAVLRDKNCQRNCRYSESINPPHQKWRPVTPHPPKCAGLLAVRMNLRHPSQPTTLSRIRRLNRYAAAGRRCSWAPRNSAIAPGPDRLVLARPDRSSASGL
jgi:hypothetical protein